MIQPNHPKQVRPLGGLFSMVKDADVPTVWSNGPRNKYDPGYFPLFCGCHLCEEKLLGVSYCLIFSSSYGLAHVFYGRISLGYIGHKTLSVCGHVLIFMQSSTCCYVRPDCFLFVGLRFINSFLDRLS